MTAQDDKTDHVLANRVSWDVDAENWVERGRILWAADEITWGIWGVPEAELGLLPEVRGLDAVELGCGTGYVSSWLSRRGARPVGLDNSGNQLARARTFQEEFGIRFPLIHADAERVPLRDASVDLAISEYGAAIWCDPYRWIPEASRILRPGGPLVFLGHSYIAMLTFPDDDLPASEQLQRDHFGMHRFDWPEATDGAIEFALTHGDMIKLLRESGLRSRTWWRSGRRRAPGCPRIRSRHPSGLGDGPSRRPGRPARRGDTQRISAPFTALVRPRRGGLPPSVPTSNALLRTSSRRA
jgi:SAM-dependent methyltransferase